MGEPIAQHPSVVSAVSRLDKVFVHIAVIGGG